MNPSTAMAQVIMSQLFNGGVREVVLSPGSRSAPLAVALHEADVAGWMRLHVRIDERSAGFLALGLAKASGQPVPVVCTSGTAAANLHPAVLEAHHAGVPLVVLTADRPPELRGVGANQASELQPTVYGGAVRLAVELALASGRVGEVAYWRATLARVLAAATGRRSSDPGPVHVDVPFREPLLPDGDTTWVEPIVGPPHSVVMSAERPSGEGRVRLGQGPRTVVVAGDGAGWQARWLAEAAGWPLLAEPSSGARSGPNALACYRLLLERLGGDIERVVQFGHPTLSRPISRLLARDDVELVVVSSTPRWSDAGHRAALVAPSIGLDWVAAGAGRAEPDAWLRRWLDADAAACQAVRCVLDDSPLSGPRVAAELAAALPPQALLMVGSSNPVRDLDLADPWDDPLPLDDAPPARRVLANRGLAGIDGTVSTAIGAALAVQRERPGSSYALLGDLTFLHDANGLVLGPDEPRPDLTLVVVNDDGGGIFTTLEQGGPEHAGSFERVFGTPHHVDLAALCAATGTAHERLQTVEGLRKALVPRPGLRVVEVPIARTDRR
ncbi:MAG TPA: 2-succinyl-5-enolpyruvyl-6-hydroxy-3-cyclohexene-1-carboxylic-acid synthase, partial [Actinomycetes bacterium]|nr:2-succinyl-5-enolpyruvyl-6-hydroxy-3-cyclohexene-1-carboxylic-acid synthase [Actinomycetes bacterium]